MKNLFNKSKKGNVELIGMGVMALMIAGFLLVMGLIMMDEMLINTATDNSGTVHNETLTTVDETGEVVSNAGKCGFNSFTVLYMHNETGTGLDRMEIGSGNYTITDREGGVYFVNASAGGGGDDSLNGTNWNITYSYKYGASESCAATNETIFGQGRFADYFDLIVLAIVIAVVISLITIGFAMRRTR